MNKPNQKDSPKNPMTPKDASRIQSHADKTGTNQEFKARAQAAATRNARTDHVKDEKKR